MKAILQLGNLNLKKKNKKAVSAIIAYVLLVTMAIALSVLVFNWLRFYISPSETTSCPEGISLVIKDFECIQGKTGSLNLTLKNKGLFNVTGFNVRVNDRNNSEIGIYSFSNDQVGNGKDGVSLAPGEEYNGLYLFSDAEGNSVDLEIIKLVEVQPFIRENGDKIFCETVSSAD